MTWFHIDDSFWSHPKTINLSRGAVALWVRAGSYCGKHLTDGFLSEQALWMCQGTTEEATELVEASLWLRAANGWQFHDWADYQDTKDTVLKRREAWRNRQNRNRNNSPKNDNEQEVHSIPFHSEGTRDSREVSRRDTQRDSRDDESLFDEFWSAYPKKVGKGAAKKAWERAIESTTPAVVIAAAKRYRDAPNRTDKFTAHPATWLNHGRWDDEYPVAVLVPDGWSVRPDGTRVDPVGGLWSPEGVAL